MKALFVVGPSGSGKSTLANTLCQIYSQTFGRETVTLVSLDAANYLSQGKDIQINQLITIQDVMEQYEIGPNAAILYAMDFLYQNIQWLINKLDAIITRIKQTQTQSQYYNHIFIFDLPGQIQLYINTQSVLKIIKKLQQHITKQSGTSACMLELFDCTYMHNVNQFISLCMMSLSTMIHMQMPHINLLNKIDIIKSAQQKPSRGFLNQYFRVSSAVQLVNELREKEQPIENSVNLIAKVIDTYGQVSFMPCSAYKKELIANVIYQIQRISGTLEISLADKKFKLLVEDVDDFSTEKAITSLQNQYYEEEEEDYKQFFKDIKKQQKNKSKN